MQPTNFTLVFSDLHVYASMFSVVLMNYIFMDGKCDYFQGEHPPFPGMWGLLGPALGLLGLWVYERSWAPSWSCPLQQFQG